MKRVIAIVILFIVIIGGIDQAHATFITFSEISDFNNAYGPFDVFLNFRTDKTGSDHFDYTSYKDRPGSYFSDDVTFSSPDYYAQEQVLWGHFDGDDGGIAPRPGFSGKLKLDFRTPVTAVGFRNPGMQPGINVQFLGLSGEQLGQVIGTPVSFVGAVSSDPIKNIIIEGTGGNPYAITALRFNHMSSAVPEPSTLLLVSSGLAGMAVFGKLKKMNNKKYFEEGGSDNAY